VAQNNPEATVFIGRMEAPENRPPVKLDLVGAQGVKRLREMSSVIESHAKASAAVYIAGKPAEVAAALVELSERGQFSQVNAAMSLRGEKSKG